MSHVVPCDLLFNVERLRSLDPKTREYTLFDVPNETPPTLEDLRRSKRTTDFLVVNGSLSSDFFSPVTSDNLRFHLNFTPYRTPLKFSFGSPTRTVCPQEILNISQEVPVELLKFFNSQIPRQPIKQGDNLVQFSIHETNSYINMEENGFVVTKTFFRLCPGVKERK